VIMLPQSAAGTSGNAAPGKRARSQGEADRVPPIGLATGQAPRHYEHPTSAKLARVRRELPNRT
jgi:hypothetical protein